MNIFITGLPGIGKTTVILRAIQKLETMGFRVGGMISQEVREGGVRIGFELIDLTSNRRGWLAHVNQPIGPKVSRYRVNLKDLTEIGVAAICKAVEISDFVVIDEVGPMELYSDEFQAAVKLALESPKPLIGTIHLKARHPLVNYIRKKAEIYTVTFENREELPKLIVNKIAAILKPSNR
ncbi:MAG: NTPase [Candidatus Bathyarchaeia archaeon]